MSDFKGGGKPYPGKAEFHGDNGKMENIGEMVCYGTGKNVPDHVDNKPSELTFPN